MATIPDRGGPTTLAVVIATAIVAALGGYFVGQASSIGLLAKSDRRTDSTSSDDSDIEEDDDTQDMPLRDPTYTPGECKLVLVVRTDLGMTKGKIAAQCSHATLACYKSVQKSQQKILRQWERYGQAKVAVKVESEDELELLQAKAMSLGICAEVVHDAGRTQIAAGSATVLGVGPAEKGKVDEVTGHLKLL